MFTTLAVNSILHAAAAAPPAHCDGQWSAAPGGTPSANSVDGPVLGNGALAVAVSHELGRPDSRGDTNTSTLLFWIDRNDAWVPATGDISCCGYDMDGAGGRTLGFLSLAVPKTAGAAAFRATQHIANGTVITAAGTDHGGTLRTASFVARGSDVLVTEVWWDVPASPAAPPPLLLEIVNEPTGCEGWTQGCYCHVLKQNKSQMSSSKQIGHPYQNVASSTIGRRHLYKAAWATAIVTPPTPPPTPPHCPPPTPPTPPSVCFFHDSDCCNCLGATSLGTDWPGPCVMLNVTLPSPYNGLINPHSCVPSSWWKQFESRYPVAHSCTSCSDDKTCPHIPHGGGPRQFALSPDGSKITVVTAVLSNFDPDYLPAEARDPNVYPDPTAPAQQLARNVSNLKVLAELRASTTAWWGEYWEKSSVSLPSAPAMENQWYRALYVLASSHRTDITPFSVAPGIVWPKTTDAPSFRGAFTMNYNQEALYYGIHAANHAEIGTPFYNAMLQYIPRGRKDAETQFQCPGINMECEIFHWGQTVSGLGDQGQRSNAALAAVPMANHWLWNRDVEWLNATGWPFLDEVAQFWECYLQKGFNYPGTPNGSYSSVNDCLGELCCETNDSPGYPSLHFSDPEVVDVNPHITLALLRFLFPVFVDATEALGIEPERRKLWQHLHSNLAPLPLAYNVSGNKTVFGDVLGSKVYSATLNIYLGWPGYDDALTTDATLRQTLKNTLDVLPVFFAWPQYPAARVRLQDYATQANATWNTLIGTMDRISANGLQKGQGVDGTMAGGLGIVNELLLQTHTGVIELFPQVPPGQPASFTNLRGRGAFLVSASMAAGTRDQIDDVAIVSEMGGAVTLRSPWASHPSVSVVASSSGAAVAVRSAGNGVFSWDTKPGLTYAVAPK